MFSDIEEFFSREIRWREEFNELRRIFLGTELAEAFKWGKPCYMLNGANVALIHGFKNYCAVLFIKGAAMRDPRRILVQQTKSVQAGRQIRFTGLPQIADMEGVIKEYIAEAVHVEGSGANVQFKKTGEYQIPAELEAEFKDDPSFREAFYALTPGRRNGYLLHFSGAKQPATRASRIEKYKDRISDGLGLNDR